MNLYEPYDSRRPDDQDEPEPLASHQFRRIRDRLVSLPEMDRRELKRILEDTLNHDDTDNSTMVGMRVPRNAKALLNELAQAKDITVSAYCRAAVLTQLRHDVDTIN